MANRATTILAGVERQSFATRQITSRKRLIVVAISACFASAPAWSNPTAPQVVNGSASFNRAGKLLTVSNSNGAIINWNTFSIGAGETTRFNQASAASSVLNRVIANDPSVLLGTLSSNGRVWLVNPAGIMVGQGARIDVAGFIASTLNVRNEDFLAGRLNFGATPNAGKVENHGKITTPSGGSVYLVAPAVENHGIINAPNGEVILAAGQTAQLIDTGTPGVKVDITGGEGNVTNLGEIVAEAGRIGLAGVLVKNSGTLNASSVVREGGRVFLKASKDAYVDGAGRIVTTGTKGGSIEVLGNRVAVMDQVQLYASGVSGGGTVLVGGDYQGKNPNIQNATATYIGPDTSIKADATTIGDGGKVIVWSNEATRAYGSISARGGAEGGNGGFVETSGHWLDVAGIRVDASAARGKGGSWLLDPYDVTISTSDSTTGGFTTPSWEAGTNNSNVYNDDIKDALNLGTSVTIETGSTGAQAGDITVAANIITTAGGPTGSPTLTLKADRAIIVNSGIKISAWDEGLPTPAPTSSNGVLNVILNADASGTGGSIQMHPGSRISTNGGDIVMGGGADPLTNPATGFGTVDPFRHGIYLEGATLNSGAGNISLIGKGAAGTIGWGIVAFGGTTISASGGTINLDGTAGAGPSDNRGVYMEDAGTIIQSTNGNISIVGTGGAGPYTTGIMIADGPQIISTGTAEISLVGTSNGTLDYNTGVRLLDAGTVIQSTNGDISITGTGTGSGIQNYGVWLNNGARIISTGPAAITLQGTGASGNAGIFADSVGSSSIIGGTSATGPISLTALTNGLSISAATIQSSGGIELTGNAVTVGALNTTGITGAEGTPAIAVGYLGGVGGTGGTGGAGGAVTINATTSIATGSITTTGGAGGAGGLATGSTAVPMAPFLRGGTGGLGGNGGDVVLSISNPSGSISTGNIYTSGGQGGGGGNTSRVFEYYFYSSAVDSCPSSCFYYRNAGGNGGQGGSGGQAGINVTGGSINGSLMSVGSGTGTINTSRGIGGAVGLNTNPTGSIYTFTSPYAGALGYNSGDIRIAATAGDINFGALPIAFGSFITNSVGNGIQFIASGNINANADVDVSPIPATNIQFRAGNNINLADPGGPHTIITDGQHVVLSANDDTSQASWTLNGTGPDGRIIGNGSVVTYGGDATLSGYGVSMGAITTSGPSDGTYRNGNIAIAATGDNISTGAITTRALKANWNAGSVTLQTTTGNIIVTGNIDARGANGDSASSSYYSGSSGGSVKLFRTDELTAGSIGVTGNILTYGGNALADSGYSGGSGGYVYIGRDQYADYAVNGSVGIGNIDTHGGDGASGEFGNNGGNGGTGRNVVIRASGAVTTGAIDTHGGNAGNGSAAYDGGSGRDGGEGGPGGRVTVYGGSIATGAITTKGGRGGDGGDGYAGYQGGDGGEGSSGGDAVLYSGSHITVSGAINTSGGDSGNGGAYGGSGSYSYGDNLDAGNVTLFASSGNVKFASIAAIGGNGGQGRDGEGFSYGGGGSDGGDGGYVNINGGLSVGISTGGTGTIAASGGSGGDGGSGVPGYGGSSGGTGGRGGDVNINGEIIPYGGPVSIGSIDARGGGGGAGGAGAPGYYAGTGRDGGPGGKVWISGSSISTMGDAIGAIIASGGNGGNGGAHSSSTGSGGNAGYGGYVYLETSSGAVNAGDIDTHGGNGGNAGIGAVGRYGGDGGWGGSVEIVDTSSITTGSITTLGGEGGHGGGGDSYLNYNYNNSPYTYHYGAGTGGDGGGINLHSTGAISVGSIDASGGNGGYTGLAPDTNTYSSGTTGVDGRGAYDSRYDEVYDITINGGSVVIGGGSITLNNGGRWLAYAPSPANVTKNGLTSDFRHYDATWEDYFSPDEVGNGFIYASVPGTITVDTTLASGAASNTFGQAPTAAFGYTLAGTVDKEDIVGTAAFTPAISGTTNVGSYSVAYAGGLTSATSFSGVGLGSPVSYTINTGSGLSYTVDPALLAAITAGLTGTVSKTYDSTTTATLAPGNFLLSGFVNSDSASVTKTAGSYSGKNIGSNILVSATLAPGDFSPVGSTNLSNYVLPTSASGNIGVITPATLTVSGVTAQNKVYDATTLATINGTAALSGVLGTDVVALGGSASGSFADKNVGVAKPVSVSGLTLSGADAANYTLTSTSAGTSADITPASLTVSGLTAQNKVYDATTVATIGGTAAFSGILGSDVVTLGDSASASFADKNVGIAKPVSVTGLTLVGADAANYTLTSANASTSAAITPASLTLSGLVAQNKVYDATTVATITGTAAFSGLLSTDVVTLGDSASASFADKHVGVAKPVTVAGFALAGADAGNYTLVPPVDFSANITPATLSLNSVNAANKVYDATTVATVNGGSLSGLIAGDVVSVSGNGTFADKNVGAAKSVTVSVNGITLTGADAGNYTLSGTTAATTADITVRPLSTWIGGASGNWSVASNWDALPDLSNVLAVSVSTGSVTYDAAAGGTNLASLTAAGLNIAGGSLSIADNLTVSSSFSQSGGALGFGGGANASITQASGNLNLPALSLANLSLAAPAGAITQSGAIIAAALNTQSQAGTTLTNSGNSVGSIAAANNGSGNVSLTNTGALTITTITNTNGNISVDNAGAVTTVGAVSAPAGAVSILAHSPLNIGAAGVSASGAIALTAGATAGAGDTLTLTGPVSSTGSGGSIALFAGDDLVQNANVTTSGGAVSALSQTGNISMALGTTTSTAGGSIGYSASSGNVVLTSLNAGSGGIALNAGRGIQTAPGFSGANLIGGSAVIVSGGNANLNTQVRLLDVTVEGKFSVTDLLTGTVFTDVPAAAPLPILNQVVSTIVATTQQQPTQPTSQTTAPPPPPPPTTSGGSGPLLLSSTTQTIGGTADTFGGGSVVDSLPATSAGSSGGSSGTPASGQGDKPATDKPVADKSASAKADEKKDDKKDDDKKKDEEPKAKKEDRPVAKKLPTCGR